MSKHGTEFKFIEPVQKSSRPDDEHVAITIEIMGEKSAPQIAVWMAEELEDDIKADSRLRAGIVDALQDFLNKIAKVN